MEIVLWMVLVFIAFAAIGMLLSAIDEAEKRREYDPDKQERLYYL